MRHEKKSWIWRFQVLGPLGEKHLSRDWVWKLVMYSPKFSIIKVRGASIVCFGDSGIEGFVCLSCFPFKH